MRVNVLQWFMLREREASYHQSEIDPDHLRYPMIRHLLLLLASLYRLWRNLDSYLMERLGEVNPALHI